MTIPSGNHSKEELEKFKKLFDAYYEQIRNFIYYKSGDIDLAEDISQDVFLRAWKMRDKLRDDTVKSLLYTIAENLLRNSFKHQKVVYNFVNAFNENNQSEPADFELEKEEFNRHLQNILAEIPEKSRLIFLMNRIDDLTYAEIAQRLNISVKAIEKHMSKALSIIKNKINYKI